MERSYMVTGLVTPILFVYLVWHRFPRRFGAVLYQSQRAAQVRALSDEEVVDLVNQNTEGCQIDFLGSRG